jgi:DNA topoisomerase-3
MVVIYAEKPDVGNKIAAALGGFELSGKKITSASLKANEKAVRALQSRQGYLDTAYNGKPCKVTWGFGHLCELMQAADYNAEYKQWRKLPVPFVPDSFKLKARSGYSSGKTADQLKLIKKLFSEAEYIINATDFDREGEVIFAYVYEYCKCKTPFKRAHFSSLTESGLRAGFDALKTSAEIKPIEMAGRARNIADWLVGSNLTAQITLKHSTEGVLSVGRVQTPTLNMIVERELAIRNFKSTPFWTVKAMFTTDSGEKYAGEHKTKRFETKAQADSVLAEIAGRQGIVASVDAKRSSMAVPNLYSLSVLQMDANESYGMTLAETLAAAQKLYDGGYITYPRTDSQFLTDDMRPVAAAALNAVGRLPQYSTYVKGAGAISDPRRFFDSSKVSSHFAIIPTTSVPGALSGHEANIYDLVCKSLIRMHYPAAQIEKTTVITDVNSHSFLSRGTVIVLPGWLAVGGKLKEETLPVLSVKQMVDGEYAVKEGKTEPPKRFTDKTIVAAMKTAGKDLPDEELRKILADPSVEGIGTEATRANIIETLVSRSYIERKGKAIFATEKGIELIRIFPCSALKSPELTANWEKRLGNIARGTEMFDNFLADIKSETAKWCSEITALKGVAASASSAPTTAHSMSASGGSPSSGSSMVCPLCGSAIVKYSWGWGCSGYKAGCKCSVSAVIAGKKITEAQAKALFGKGETSVLKGFKGKSGKEFDTKLVLRNGKVEFDFSSVSKNKPA